MPAPLADAIRACRPHILSAAGFSALVNILYLAPTIYMMQVYDRVVPTGGVLTLVWLTVVIAVAIATMTILDAIRSRIMTRAALRLNARLGAEILDRLMARPVTGANQPSTAQAMREFDHLRQTIGGQGLMAMFDMPWTPLYLIVAYMIHPALAGLVVGGGVVLVGLAIINERSTRASAKIGHQASSLAYAAQDAILTKAEVIRSLGMRRAIVARQMASREQGLSATAQSQVAASHYSALVKFFRTFLQSAALGVGAYLAVKGDISAGSIIAASVLLARALQPIEQMVNVWPAIRQAEDALETLSRLFEGTDSLMTRPLLLPEPQGHVTVSNVALTNPDGTALILRGVSITLVPGEIVGLVGPSGAGKTSLAKVVAGAVSPTAGHVRIDGAKYSDWDPELLATHFGYLPQTNMLLPGTIAENISRFTLASPLDGAEIDARVIKAAQLARVHDMILGLPGGYNAQIGDNGNGLSGGQAQRIALARALYGDPKVLILDEPSASLDAEGEAALLRAINHAQNRKAAILLVAHRASTLRNVNRLVVMSQGTLEQQGPRDQVINSLREASTPAKIVNIS
jgi:ATP-binding cassette subfamily C protein